MSGSGQLSTPILADREESHWTWRLLRKLVHRWRPRQGWVSLLLMLWLQLLFILSLRNTDWVDFSTAHLPPEVLALASLFLLWGVVRPHPRPQPAKPLLRRLAWGLVLTAMGLALWLQQMTNLMGRWLQWNPQRGIGLDLWLRDMAAFVRDVSQDSVLILSTRFDFWLQGVLGSGAQQDDLIFIGLISLLVFLLTTQACWMFLAGHSILASMVPSLWLYALMLYYSRGPRLELVLYLAFLFVLWTWRHQRQLEDAWRQRRIDFPEGVGLDRAMSVLVALLVMAVCTLALPSIRFDAMRDWANNLLNPIDEATVDLGQRMFPELQTKFHGRRQSTAGGLPNSFLLGSPPELSTQVAMIVDTSFPFAEEQGFYMRGMTFQRYDGKGWSNDVAVSTQVLPANEPLPAPLYPHVRKIWHFVEVHNTSSVIYAIPEAVQFSVNARPVQSQEHEHVIMYRNSDRNTYSALSAMPLLSEEVLAAVPLDAYPALDETAPLAPFLQVPPTVPARTRRLALALTEEHATPYAKGLAVEQYLRTFPYDLDVPLPGPQVEDLADHFLFELQRGYCDYYTTAFVVLMRLAGIPARFAVGYAPGAFEPYTERWTITDAQAHAWPEIWLPGLGWIPFEPTAGRRAMARDFVPLDLDPAAATEAGDNAGQDTEVAAAFWPNPQIWFWVGLLIVMGGLVLAPRLRADRDPDPWRALLLWGRRLGQAKAPWQTEREYAAALTAVLMAKSRLAQEERRVLASDLRRLAEDVVAAKYAVIGTDPGRLQSIRETWAKLRARFWRIWVFRL